MQEASFSHRNWQFFVKIIIHRLKTEKVNDHRQRRWLENCPGRCAVTGFMIDSEISVDSVWSPNLCPPPISYTSGSLLHSIPPYPHSSRVTTNDDPNSASLTARISQRSFTYISDKSQYDTCIHKSYVLTSENDPFVPPWLLLHLPGRYKFIGALQFLLR